MAERALRGVSAAPGVAFGKAVVLDRVSASDARVISPPERARELERAREALRLVATELEQIASGLREAGRHEEADIIETSVMMAGDPGLDASVASLVMEAGRTGGAAMIDATEETDEITRLEAKYGVPGLPTVLLMACNEPVPAPQECSVPRDGPGRVTGFIPPAEMIERMRRIQ